MVKPILLVGYPINGLDPLDVFHDLQDAINPISQQLKEDYYVLAYLMYEGKDLKFQVFYEKDFSDIKYEELKELIISSLKK